MPTLDNDQLHTALATWVESEQAQQLQGPGPLHRGPWMILDFSSCFSIERHTPSGRFGVFIKVPKADIPRQQAYPAGERDRAMAREEYRSLRYLERFWPGQRDQVTFVRPLGFHQDHNAIVTWREYGIDLFLLFRSRDLRRRWPGAASGDDAVQAAMARIGRTLAGFHQAASGDAGWEPQPFPHARLLAKIATARHDLVTEHGVDRARLERLLAPVEPLLRQREGARHTPTWTLKGFDIRNIMHDDALRLFLLDPGKLRQDAAEADLGRFLTTCRILYWGSLWFFLGLTPHARYEQAFLEGYRQAGGRVQDDLFHMFMIKELLKMWRAAHVALALKPWPRALKWVLRHSYVDPFYFRQIDKEIGHLSP